jgi:hypothetical protein
MTLAIWEGKHSTSQSHGAEPSGDSNNVRPGEGALQSAL